MTENHAAGIRWDLSDLYKSSADPKIAADLKLARDKAIAFESSYKAAFEKIGSNGAFPMAALIKDYKELAVILTKLSVFPHLSFAENTADPAVGAFMQKIQTELTDIQSHLIFFEVSWNKLDARLAKDIMDRPDVANERHYLERMRAWAPHTLEVGEEKIMSKKSNTGSSAFSRLFDEVMNNIPFFIDGVKKTEGEVLALLHSGERAERKKASDSLAAGLEPNTRLLTYIYNMILADHRLDLGIRKFAHPMDPMNLSNDTERASVMGLMKSVKAAYPIAQRYYKMKAKLLKLDKMADYDRYAPLDEDEEKLPWAKCKEIVLAGYYAFSEQAGKIAEEFFEKRWIDAEVRMGKQGGGFCCSTTPDLHPYVLVNYTGTLRDVMTVAHELGHGIHQYLAAKKVGILESNAPLTMAETASVFGEMLIFEKIVSDIKDPKKRLGLIAGKIDDNFATVYRQIAMTDYELQAHETGLKEGELSAEKLSDFWIKANGELYGDSVELTPNYRHGWKYIPHFVHTPFYCYAYAYAQLFVLSLFQKYKEDRAGFVPKYFEMLSLGGSKKPTDIARIAGLDLNDPNFWNSGLTLLDDLVKEAEALAK